MADKSGQVGPGKLHGNVSDALKVYSIGVPFGRYINRVIYVSVLPLHHMPRYPVDNQHDFMPVTHHCCFVLRTAKPCFGLHRLLKCG